MALCAERDIVSGTANNAGFTRRRGKRAVKKSDRIIGGLALLSVAIIVIKLAGAIYGYDLIQMAVDATRPKDAGGWPTAVN
ncbi:hypothetical protein GA0061100_102709 [Rhizobium hainanense]|uniref:Uncharacterized protein n=1 Tax=Rhizobium hainanense TaxID=52131 RepID=A0A1C3UMW7_9HYPH|nr:hypothetical protein GA0061100_102709 [Rhizobium hainanense]